MKNIVNKTIYPAAIILVIFSGISTSLYAQADIIRPIGELERASPDDIWPKTMSGSSFNEFWTYHFYLENDLEMTIVYSVANFGTLKSPVSGARASILGFDDNIYQVSREYPLDRLVTVEENYQVRLRPDRDLWFDGELPGCHKVSFVTSKDGIQYDIQLDFTNIQQGYKWGDGIFSVDGNRVGIVTHIPYAEVSGIVKINDREKRVNGTAYMDHVFQDKITTRLFSDGFRFVYHRDQENWEAGHFLGSNRRDDRNVIGYTLISRNGRVSLKKPERMVRSGPERVFGHSLPKNLRIEFSDGSSRSVERVHDRERFEMLQELGGLARRIARGYLRGEVIEFRGDARFTGINHADPVKYNYFIVD